MKTENLRTDDFNYDLPSELIAQSPLEKRDSSKLMILDKNTGDIIEQRSTIKVSLSRGKLKMLKFSSYDDFKSWADKYEIKYEEKREFNNKVKAGEVISYSYKSGDTIKNGDTIISEWNL